MPEPNPKPRDMQQPRDMQLSRPLGSSALGIEAAAEMETYFALRSADIAAHLGLSPAFLRRQQETNPAYWQYLERRWMSEAFGPLAPLHQLAQLARQDRQRLRDARHGARLAAWAKWERDSQEIVAVFGTTGARRCFEEGAEWEGRVEPSPAPSCPSSCPSSCHPCWWQRATLWLMTVLCRLTGWGCVLALLYYVPVWLSHHALLPFR